MAADKTAGAADNYLLTFELHGLALLYVRNEQNAWDEATEYRRSGQLLKVPQLKVADVRQSANIPGSQLLRCQRAAKGLWEASYRSRNGRLGNVRPVFMGYADRRVAYNPRSGTKRDPTLFLRFKVKIKSSPALWSAAQERAPACQNQFLFCLLYTSDA